MPESFDFATADPGSGGANLAGDTVDQGGTPVFVPACFLVYGEAGGPYTRMDATAGLPVTVASLPRASSGTTASVAASTGNQTLLSANASRQGATFRNESSAVLYLLLGANASPVNYTVAMAPGSYYEAPYGYTGRIDGVWSSAAGAARITELV